MGFLKRLFSRKKDQPLENIVSDYSLSSVRSAEE